MIMNIRDDARVPDLSQETRIVLANYDWYVKHPHGDPVELWLTVDTISRGNGGMSTDCLLDYDLTPGPAEQGIPGPHIAGAHAR